MSVGTTGSLLRKHVQGILFILQQPGSPPRSKPWVCRLQSPGPLSLDPRPEQGGTEHPWPGKGQSGVASRAGAQGSLLGEGPAQRDRGSRWEEVSETAQHPTLGKQQASPSWGAGLRASQVHTDGHPSGRSIAISKGSVSNLLPGPTLKAEPGAQPPCPLLPVPCRPPRVPRAPPSPTRVPRSPSPAFCPSLSLLRLIFQTLIHRS